MKSISVIVLLAAGLTLPACGEGNEPDREPGGAIPTSSGRTGDSPPPTVEETEPPPPAIPPEPGAAAAAADAVARGDLATVARLAAEGDPEAIRDAVRVPLEDAALRVLEADGRVGVAKLLLLPILSPVPPDPEEAEILSRAFTLLDRRRPKEAEEEVADLDDKLGEKWLLLARLATDDGTFARRIGRALAEGMPDGARIVTAGVLLAEAGNLEPAEAALESTDDPRGRAPRVLLRLLKGEGVEVALAEATRAAAGIGPEDVSLAIVRAGLLVLTGDLEGAEEALASVREAADEDPRLWEVEGALRVLRRDASGALAAFSRVLELDPGSSSAHENSARILCTLGRSEEALSHLASAGRVRRALVSSRLGAALTAELSARKLYGPDRALAEAFLDFALGHLGDDSSRDLVAKSLDRAVRLDPTFGRAWILLSEIRLKEGGLEAAIATLREGSKPLATDSDRAWLLLRLATRLLQAGEPRGFAEIAGGVAVESAAGRVLAGLGAPSEDGLVLIPDWPRCRPAMGEERYTSLAHAFFGDDVKVANRKALRDRLKESRALPRRGAVFDPRAALKDGRPVLMEMLVTGERLPMPEMVLLVGYDPGLDAYLVDDPSPWGPVLVPPRDVAGGILYCLPDGGTGEPDPDPTAERLVEVLSLRESREYAKAAEKVLDDSEHPIGVYLRVWASLLAKDARRAERILLSALERDPECEAYRLLLAETHLLVGDVAKAIGAVKGLDHLTDSMLIRRVRALGLLEAGKVAEGLAALRTILEERPGYLQVYTDLSDHLLPRRMFREGIEILHDLGRRDPRMFEEPVFQLILNRAYIGLARTAVKGEDLLPLLDAPYPEVRRNAVQAAGGLAYLDAMKVLPRLCTDPDASVRTTAVRHLGRRRYVDGAALARARLEDEDAKVRGAAVWALRQIEGMDCVEDLVGRLGDPDAYVREVAVAELRGLAGKEFGFDPRGPEKERGLAAGRWEEWLGSR